MYDMDFVTLEATIDTILSIYHYLHNYYSSQFLPELPNN